MATISENGEFKEGQSIYDFKKGDIIIRLKSALRKNIHTNENLGVDVEVVEGVDNSFRETPVEFIAIANNVIYLHNIKPWYDGTKYVYKVRLEMYEDNWQLFEIPEGLTIDDCIK